VDEGVAEMDISEIIKAAFAFNFCCGELRPFAKMCGQIEALRTRCEILGVPVSEEEMDRIKEYASTLPAPNIDTIVGALEKIISNAMKGEQNAKEI